MSAIRLENFLSAVFHIKLFLCLAMIHFPEDSLKSLRSIMLGFVKINKWLLIGFGLSLYVFEMSVFPSRSEWKEKSDYCSDRINNKQHVPNQSLPHGGGGFNLNQLMHVNNQMKFYLEKYCCKYPFHKNCNIFRLYGRPERQVNLGLFLLEK